MTITTFSFRFLQKTKSIIIELFLHKLKPLSCRQSSRANAFKKFGRLNELSAISFLPEKGKKGCRPAWNATISGARSIHHLVIRKVKCVCPGRSSNKLLCSIEIDSSLNLSSLLNRHIEITFANLQ